MAVAVATVATYALPLFFAASLALDIERDLDMTVARLAGALVVIGSLRIAAAPSLGVFVVFLGVTAVGNAIIPTAMSALVTGELRARRRGTVLGLQQAGPPCGMLSLAGAAAFVAAGRLVVRVPRVVAG